MKIKFSRLFKIIVVFVFFVTLFFKISYQPARACSCARPLPPLAEKERAAAVFAGTVINQERSRSQVKINFRVQTVWKGNIDNTVTIITNTNSAACGINFANRQRYLVYAFDNQNELRTNLCSRTQLYSRAREDLTALGIGTRPRAENISSLNNINWQLDRFNNRRIIGTITANFNNTRITGNASCNIYNASYRQKGNAIKFSPIATTRRACRNQNLQQQERNYLEALKDAYSFQIERNLLIIDYYNGSNEGTLVYSQNNRRR